SAETLPLTAVIDSALCIGSGGSSGSLADKTIVRTADGRLLIPAAQLKGRLRHECEKLARGLQWPICRSPNAETMCPQWSDLDAPARAAFHRPDYQLAGVRGHHCLVCQLFGNPVLPSRLIFDDLVCPDIPATLPEVLRPGVGINRRRRTAEDQRLYFLETSPVNMQLRFSGQIQLRAGTPIFAKALLGAALSHIHSLGSRKSAGLGWLTWEFDLGTVTAEAWEVLARGANHAAN
ncbi:MAG: RAMP superfamily CRISPR-associated protein, partial [Cyanobacteria bacterium P01_H01_bin.121]